MKHLATIFSVYILLLALVPCTDGFHQHEYSEQSALVMEQGKSHSAPHDDHCTPFCSCHCCHMHTLVKQAVSADIAFVPATFHEITPTPKGYLLPRKLLQPPQV